YEIIDNIYPSEEIAQNKVNIWKERGFKSYYERYLRNNMPYYKVKLWGYATAEEAEKVRKMLSKKYKGNFQVR
ncbi:MAG TPA: SPOR domain-containing protein, partial [Candidatus Kapabacteria bacterium]|nr:SPOR domain-containing protein [Candidatus Kapabacteria bacterium]